MLTLGQAIRQATTTLSEAGVASPLVDARLIAAHFCHCKPLEVSLKHDQPVPAGFAEAIAQRAARIPLQHILGVAPMGELSLEVGPGVFVPRPETEVLAQWAVSQLTGVEKPRVVDFCTGSGALAAYVAHAVPEAALKAVEIDPEAAAWAQRNFVTHAPKVELVIGDATNPALLANWQETVDLVVSNPPYVPETPDLQPEIYHDPPHAVFAGETGLDIISELVEPIYRALKPGGKIGLEHDESHADAVEELFRRHGGFVQIEPMEDLTGRIRFVTASKL